MSQPTRTETYAAWLSRELDDRGHSTRSFARQWKPTDPETGRRQLRRYLNGQVPHDRTKRELAECLGTEKIGPDEDDDEESDLLAALERRVSEITTLLERARAERTAAA